MAPVGLDELHLHPGVGSHRHVGKFHEVLAALALRIAQRPFEPEGVRPYSLSRSPGRKLRFRDDEAHLRCRKEVEPDVSALDEAGGRDEHGKAEGDDDGRGPCRRTHHRSKHPLAHPRTRCPHRGTQSPGAPAKGKVCAQVSRQDQEALDDRGHYHAYDHERELEQEVPHESTDEEQRNERGNRGQGRTRHRDEHAMCGALGRVDRPETSLAVGEAVLRDHNRVVDDDAQRHDEREKAEHVDAPAGRMEQGERGHERYGNSERYPESHLRVEEQEQDDEHEGPAGGAVPEEDRDSFGDQRPCLIEGMNLHTRRERGPDFRKPGAKYLSRIESISGGGALEFQHQGRTSVVEHLDLAGARAAFNGRDVAQLQAPALLVAEHRDLLEFDLLTPLSQRP